MNLGNRWQQWRTRRAVARRPITDTLWHSLLARHPYLSYRGVDRVAALRTLASLFLDTKQFSGAGGFVVTDMVALSVAAQACLPVLELGLAPYGSFVGIVMHSNEVVASRLVHDEHGLVHQYDEVIAGEAMQDGPIMLSWADARGRPDAPASYNVVVHEFAHALDMHAGVTRASRWKRPLQHEFDHFAERVVCGHDTVLDPYGAQSLEEFFAVASESFFVTPRALQADRPLLYDQLRGIYRQDPAPWQAGGDHPIAAPAADDVSS